MFTLCCLDADLVIGAIPTIPYNFRSSAVPMQTEIISRQLVPLGLTVLRYPKRIPYHAVDMCNLQLSVITVHDLLRAFMRAHPCLALIQLVV
jgi:hypothetical protein